ncbi:gag polymerase env [Moniliophthora roreri MCA 2997]|uniref:Gag polymerase env n=1 Tax=Moniliophthora roreri (strain MCA 2997) TaxID=1381753 RepID=V2WJS4_MONRO|nr:gag polymerase env [Moniliophthora roreri MCA 2997]
MIDSGATGLFTSRSWVIEHKVWRHLLKREIPLYNIDGTKNRAGSISEFMRLELTIGDYVEVVELLVTDLGPEEVILGLPWLRKVNPDIDWKAGLMNIRVEEEEEVKKEEVEVEEQYQRIMGNHQQRRKWWKEGILEDTTDELWVATGVTYSAELAYEELKKKKKRSMEEIVPIEFHEYRKVFSEEESHRLPEHKPYDHTIDLKPDAPETIRSKVYPMSVNEQGELDQFLEENLRKGYIVPSKSPMASPVFFVKKKDGKLRFVQDYRKLNEFTVKNRYPLPLASDIIN